MTNVVAFQPRKSLQRSTKNPRDVYLHPARSPIHIPVNKTRIYEVGAIILGHRFALHVVADNPRQAYSIWRRHSAIKSAFARARLDVNPQPAPEVVVKDIDMPVVTIQGQIGNMDLPIRVAACPSTVAFGMHAKTYRGRKPKDFPFG